MLCLEEYPNCGKIEAGEIGAFIIGNETYIKVYEKNGLHSLNPAYKTMKFNEDDRVYLIGKIVGKLTDCICRSRTGVYMGIIFIHLMTFWLHRYPHYYHPVYIWIGCTR